MAKITSLPTIAGALLAFGLSAVPAHAANRTFVSGNGTDSGACTRAAPCKTFARALTQTTAGGEIDVLDPGGYGMVTIAKAISIVNDGVGTTGILAPSGNAITINAGANDSVHLRGLTIEGLGSGANDVQLTTGGNLAIENCVVRNFTNAGINIGPSASSSFSVSNTIASNNGNGTGIVVQPTGSAVVTGVLSKVTANNNAGGILLNGTLSSAPPKVVIVDSEASNNTNSGIAAAGSPVTPLPTFAALRNVVASNNVTGLSSGQNATLLVAHSVVTWNGTGVSVPAGAIFSYGDNDIDGNTNNNTGALTPLAMH